MCKLCLMLLTWCLLHLNTETVHSPWPVFWKNIVFLGHCISHKYDYLLLKPIENCHLLYSIWAIVCPLKYYFLYLVSFNTYSITMTISLNDFNLSFSLCPSYSLSSLFSVICIYDYGGIIVLCTSSNMNNINVSFFSCIYVIWWHLIFHDYQLIIYVNKYLS